MGVLMDAEPAVTVRASAWARGALRGPAHPNVMDSTLLITASLCQACQIGLAG